MRVVAGEDRRARRPATRGVVELCEAQAVLRKRIEIRRRDLAAVTARVREAHVVGENEKDVRRGGRGGGGEDEPDKPEHDGKEAKLHKVE